VNSSDLLSIFLRGAIGSKGRKTARKAARFLSGHSGFLTASTVLGAAGVAWGLYETLQNQGSTGTPVGAAGATGAAGAARATGATGATLVPPPIPGDERGFPDDMLRVVRLAVSAARADGTLLPAERVLILSHAREAGVESVVELELSAPRPLSEIVGGITDDQRRRDLYVLAYTIVRADESVSGAERVYLAQLAHQLGLDAATAAALEADTAAKIDVQPDTPAESGGVPHGSGGPP
jgi:uncharacterized membrane protein YebE (DUF533 family)